MEYSISDISRIIEAVSPEDTAVIPDLKIKRLLTDSRSLTYPDETLFFALTTPSGDGHRYIRELYDRGVRNFVVSQIPEGMTGAAGVNFLVVPSPLE